MYNFLKCSPRVLLVELLVDTLSISEPTPRENRCETQIITENTEHSRIFVFDNNDDASPKVKQEPLPPLSRCLSPLPSSLFSSLWF